MFTLAFCSSIVIIWNRKPTKSPYFWSMKNMVLHNLWWIEIAISLKDALCEVSK